MRALMCLALRQAATIVYIFTPLPVCICEELHYAVKKTKPFTAHSYASISSHVSKPLLVRRGLSAM